MMSMGYNDGTAGAGYNPPLTPIPPPPSSAGLSNVQFAPNVTQETFTTGSDDEDDDMIMMEYQAGGGAGGDMPFDGYGAAGEGTSPQSVGSGSGSGSNAGGGDFGPGPLSPPPGSAGKQKIIPQAKLFPPSATPAPPPTRKRCPPGKRRSMGAFFFYVSI
jgi:hypothetical protein